MKKIAIAFGAVLMALIVPLSASAQFSDVSVDDFYYGAITFLEEEGIVVGYSDGSFGYDSIINRAEFMKLAIEARYFGDVDALETVQLVVDGCFDDVPDAEWYTGYVCYAKDNGWVVGYGDGNFKPEQNINFVEGMKIVLEVFGYEYAETEIWYEGLVNRAAEDNLIPLTIDGFGQILTRAEMADMVTRMIKFNEDTLDGYLGDYADDVATYATIEAGITSEMIDQPVCTGGACGYKPVIYDQFSAWVYGDGAVISGYEILDTVDVQAVGDGFYAVSQSEGTWLSSEGMLVLDTGKSYFSTSGWVSDPDFGDTTLSNFYEYDAINDEPKKLFEYNQSGATGEEIPYYLLVGVDTWNYDLVLVSYPSIDFSPGPCGSVWLADPSWYYTVDLDLPLEERVLVPFDVPQMNLDAGEAYEAECLLAFE